jgi:hypothetical protein
MIAMATAIRERSALSVAVPEAGTSATPVEIMDYGFYTIQCTFNGRFPTNPHAGFLHVPRAGRVPCGITQYDLDPQSPEPYGNQHFHWLFIEAGGRTHRDILDQGGNVVTDRRSYYIANRRSGLCLRAPNKPGFQHLLQDHYARNRDEEFRFVLEPVEDAPHTCRLLSYASGAALIVHPARPDIKLPIMVNRDVPSTVAVGGTVADEELDKLGHATFRLEYLQRLVDPEQRAIALEQRDAGSGAAGRPPRLASLNQVLPLSFPESSRAPVMEQQTLPFFMINDPDLVYFRQIEVTPFYTLKHRQRWDMVLDRQFDGKAERETTETVVVGITNFDASSFSSTFKWSVETESEAGYEGGGFSASLKVTARIEKAVEQARQRSSEHREDRTTSETVRYPKLGYPYRIVTWVPADVYELYRTDEPEPVIAWTVRREGQNVTSIFPEAPPRSDR